jgi:hypothetical protein
LSQGQSVPVVAGGRLTGTVGKFGIGALNIQTDDKLSAGAVATNFSVVRVKRDILRRSNIGLIATRRTPAASQSSSNAVFGADANLAFFRNLSINGYYARTETPGAVGDQSSYRGRFDYAGDRYGLQLEHLLVGDKFTPEIGFLRRSDFRRSSIGARFSPRPKSNRLIRRLDWEAGYNYITDSGGTRVENKQLSGTFEVDFENSDQWTLEYIDDFEYLPRSFQIAPTVVVPVGGYDYDTIQMAYELGQQRRVSGRLSVVTGTFYDGHKTEANFTSGRVALTARLSVEPGVTMNWSRSATGQLYKSPHHRPRDLHAVGSNADQQSGAVQRERSHGQFQRAPPLGVRAWQRTLRGVQRRPVHVGRPGARTCQPLGCDQAHAIASLLTTLDISAMGAHYCGPPAPTGQDASTTFWRSVP